MAAEQATLEELIDFYGDAFLKYVLYREDAPTDTSQCTTQQMEVLSTLVSIRAMLLQQDDFVRRANLASVVTSVQPGNTRTLAIEMRATCGGNPATDVDSGDRVFDLLRGCALILYPALLLQRKQEDFFFLQSTIGTVTARVGDDDELLREIVCDPELKLLFPHYLNQDFSSATRSELMSVSSLISTSDGQTRSVGLFLVPAIVLSAARLRTLLHEEEDVDSLIRSVNEVLSELRAIARGKEVGIPVMLGLSNIEIEAGVEIKSELGILRRRRDSDDRYMFIGSVPSSCILISQMPFKILSKDANLGSEDDFEQVISKAQLKNKSGREAWQKSLDKISNLQRMALLLSRSEKPYLSAVHSGLAIFDPLSQQALRYWNGVFVSGQPAATVEPGEVDRIVEWSNKLLKNHPANLDVGLRRIVSAVGSRVDPVDALVDAVLSWENMFSGNPETTFKVCGSIANLIGETDFQSRLSMFNSLRAIYTMRSSIVHGHDPEPGMSEIMAAADKAIEVAILSYRKLHDSPDLLQAKNSSSRSTRILLGGSADKVVGSS
jgi:hypothetical protein